jgi:GNAT superfamily N-acetyltransferase
MQVNLHRQDRVSPVLAIDPGHRSRGVGEQLMRAFLACPAEKGAQRAADLRDQAGRATHPLSAAVLPPGHPCGSFASGPTGAIGGLADH